MPIEIAAIRKEISAVFGSKESMLLLENRGWSIQPSWIR
jgi:hypothetical protein